MSLKHNIYNSLFPYLAPKPDMTGLDNGAGLPNGYVLNGDQWANTAPQTPEDYVAMPSQGRDPDPPTWNVDATAPQTQPTDLPSVGLQTPTMKLPASNEIDRKDFILPYPDPKTSLEQTQNALAMANYDYQHPQNQDKGVKGVIKEILSNFFTGMAQTPQGASAKQALLLGGVGAATGLANRGWNEQRKAAEMIPILERQAQGEQNAAYRNAQMRNWDVDNQYNQEVLANRKENQDLTRKAGALNKIYSGKFFDPTNKVHAKLAVEAGLDPAELQGWDDRKLDTKMVAGTTYVYDRKDNTFKRSNIPTDESATLTDYAVKMPSGEMRTYKVAQKDAAKFATQMQVLGAQIDAADKRLTKQQEFTASENAKNRAERRDLFLKAFQERIAKEQLQLAGDLQKTAQWKAEWIRKIQGDLADGVLDQDTAASMLQLVQ